MTQVALASPSSGVSAVLKPSVAVTSGSAMAQASVDDLSSYGLLRHSIENILGFSTSLANFQSSLRSATLDGINLGQLLKQRALKGTVLVGIWKMPLWLSTSSDMTVAGGSGWFAYQTAHPSNFDTWQAVCADVATWLFLELGIRPAQFAGDPGWMIEGWNEIDLDSFWGYPGTGSHLVDAFETWRRMRAGMLSVAPTAKVASFSLSSESASHFSTAAIASWSTETDPFNSFSGGTEATGRQAGGHAYRSLWKFPTTLGPGTRGYPGEATVNEHLGLQFNTRNITPTGTVSSDLWSYYPWNTNGQGDPEVATPANRYNLVTAGAAYVTGSTAWRATGDNTIQIPLGATAKTHFDAAKTGGTTYTVGVRMEGEDAGADRYANPLGFDQAFALAAWKPSIRLALDEPLYTTFARYCSGLGINDYIVNVHRYEGVPGESAGVVANVSGLLAAAGVSAKPVVVTEWNDWKSFPADEPDRDTHLGAAWVARSVIAQCRAGLAASCKYNLVENNSGSEWYGGFGYFTFPNSIAKPSWLVQEFLQDFSALPRVVAGVLTAEMTALGVDAYGAMDGTSLSVLVARYSNLGSSTQVLLTLPPTRRAKSISICRVNSTQHNAKATFDATVGSQAAKAAAAKLVSVLDFEPQSFDRATSFPLDLEPYEVVFLRIELEPPRLRRQRTREPEEIPEAAPEPLVVEVVEAAPQTEARPVPVELPRAQRARSRPSPKSEPSRPIESWPALREAEHAVERMLLTEQVKRSRLLEEDELVILMLDLEDE